MISTGRKLALASPLLLVLASMSAACSKKSPSPPDEPPPSAIATATTTVPPVAFSGTPVAEFADAGPMEGQTPYAQARAYEASGQYWLARLVLEKKALGSEGTKEEVELLALICHHQADQSCVDECSERLGKKLKFDAGSPRLPLDATEHKEPDTDFVRARAHLLGHRLKEAREILEPKIIDGKASKEEIRLLKSICKEQGDRMCVALCDAKLK
ncbi:MAG: hypothetical protein BGO98_04865 [Myxococcales bacterium 68-20]|nr:MAG: hypothetical protein BGO98_04865 [Myxococcales bacterium 68-20]